MAERPAGRRAGKDRTGMSVSYERVIRMSNRGVMPYQGLLRHSDVWPRNLDHAVKLLRSVSQAGVSLESQPQEGSDGGNGTDR